MTDEEIDWSDEAIEAANDAYADKSAWGTGPSIVGDILEALRPYLAAVRAEGKKAGLEEAEGDIDHAKHIAAIAEYNEKAALEEVDRIRAEVTRAGQERCAKMAERTAGGERIAAAIRARTAAT